MKYLLLLISIVIALGLNFSYAKDKELIKPKDAVKTKDEDKLTKLIGDFTVLQTMRSKDKSTIYIAMHHYLTSWGSLSIKEEEAYLLIDGKKYKIHESSSRNINSEISNTTFTINEYRYDYVKNNVPSLKNATEVNFIYKGEHNKRLIKIDEKLKIVDFKEKKE